MALNYSEQRQIAQRYANAAFALAQEEKSESSVYDSLKALAHAIDASDALAAAANNPLLPEDDLASAFEAILKKLKAGALSIKIVRTVIMNGRAPLLGMIAECFEANMDHAQGALRGEVITAAALSDAELSAISDALSSKGQTLTLTSRVDESLIGGITLKLGSRMIDASVAGQLKRLKHTLKQPMAANA